MSEELRAEVAALRAEVAELRAQLGTTGMRLGPQTESFEDYQKRVKAEIARAVEAVNGVHDVPPVDRSNICTTNGKSAEEVRASQTNETGQHDGYIVLCDIERAKWFVRPYRDKYKHVGVITQLTDDAGRDSHRVRTGGCGSVTTMGRALSETYARDPKFYSHTFCVQCNRHAPVEEFVWTSDNQPVGS